MDKALALLEQLAQKLGTTAEQVWPFLVKQYALYGLLMLWVGGAICLLLSVLGIIMVVRTNDDFVMGWGIFFIFCSIVGVFFVGIPGAMRYLNPEYYAFIEVLRHVTH